MGKLKDKAQAVGKKLKDKAAAVKAKGEILKEDKAIVDKALQDLKAQPKILPDR
jgi:hypothetical protein